MDCFAKGSTGSDETAASTLVRMLLAGELILPQDLEFAMEHQKYSNAPIGEILVKIGAIEREELDRVLSLQSGLISAGRP